MNPEQESPRFISGFGRECVFSLILLLFIISRLIADNMVTAIIIINTERTRVNEVAEKLADMPQISEVYSVGGRSDLVAIVRVATNEALADTVTRHMAAVDGIVSTETHIAFRAFSRYDLEHMFSLGMEE